MSRRRRVIGWVARLGARVLAVLALVGFALWLTGTLLSDRTVWSQWLSWIPTTLTLAGMTMCVTLSWVLARIARAAGPREAAPSAAPASIHQPESHHATPIPAPARRRLAGRSARRPAFVLTLGLAGFMFCWEWNIGRSFVTYAPPRGTPFTLLYWNHASNWSPSWMDDLSRELCDITVLNAILYWDRSPQLMEKLNKEHPEHYSYQRIDSYAIISKWPIVRWARTDLNLPTVQTTLRPYATVYERGWYWNRGGAAWIEFNTKDSLGKNLVAWIIDMPSDPRLHRERIARIAGENLRAWNGAAMERGPVGQFIQSKEKMTGFPEPDLIFGDFNIPRGARSLRHIVGDAQGSFEAAGSFSGATYPSRLPLLGIDQIFTRGRVRTHTYNVFNAGFGTHLAQRADLVMTRD